MTSLQNVKPTGALGLSLLGKGNSKELELEAESVGVRDTWVRYTVSTVYNIEYTLVLRVALTLSSVVLY